jgi:hypothetical protein
MITDAARLSCVVAPPKSSMPVPTSSSATLISMLTCLVNTEEDGVLVAPAYSYIHVHDQPLHCRHGHTLLAQHAACAVNSIYCYGLKE